MSHVDFTKLTTRQRNKIKRQHAEEMRRKPTPMEARLRARLMDRGQVGGERFRNQHVMIGYIADFVCLRKRLLVEVDGGYHQKPEQVSRDRTRDGAFERRGYKTLRFTNGQVKHDLERVLAVIRNELAGRAACGNPKIRVVGVAKVPEAPVQGEVRPLPIAPEGSRSGGSGWQRRRVAKPEPFEPNPIKREHKRQEREAVESYRRIKAAKKERRTSFGKVAKRRKRMTIPGYKPGVTHHQIKAQRKREEERNKRR